MPVAAQGKRRNLQAELRETQAHIAELEATLNAIRRGEVDAVVVEGPQGSRVFTLETSDEPYRILAERMNEGAATLTADGTILFCNARLAKMLDMPMEQVAGSTLFKLLASQSQAGEVLAEAAKNDVRAEAQLLRRDGSVAPVQLSVTQIPLAGNDGLCLVVTDLSAQKRVEEEVRRLNAELEAKVNQRTAELQTSNKELEAFTYAVAHDLRAPLRHIHAFSDMLACDAESKLSSEGKHFVECILAGTARMEILLEALLNLSRLGRQPVNCTNVDLKHLVHEVIDDLASETANRKIEWRVTELPAVSCDRELMRIVYTNLLSNAVKFTRKQPKAVIEIGQQTSEGRVLLFVRDNGAGFDMRYADKLFGVFQRLHQERDFEGTGIGLATVTRILHRHGGKIWTQSEPGKGAAFYFTFEGAEARKTAAAGE